MKVKNEKKLKRPNCTCSSNLEHWEKYTGDLGRYCMAQKCYKRSALGALVQKDVDYDNSTYVIPLCHEHVGFTLGFELEPKAKLVPAIEQNTCN